MANKPKTGKQGFSWKLPAGLIVVGLVGYYLVGGSSDTTTSKGTAAPKKPASAGAADAFIPADYTASFQTLKLDPKDAFKPLIQKALIVDLTKSGLPTSVTGGGDWSYDGMVTTDGKVQGLMDEIKTGESDYITIGQHWKHGKVKRITDTEIVFDADNGTPATLKMGDSSGASAKVVVAAPSPNAPLAVQPPPLAGAIGTLDMTPLPPTDPGNGGFGGGGRGGGRRGGGRRNGINLGQ